MATAEHTYRFFPSVGDYAEAVANPSGRFASLEGLRPVVGRDGEPVFVAGTGRVTFRVELPDRGEGVYELTCFTSPAASVLSRGKYGDVLASEVFVYDRNGEGDYFPVALRICKGAGGIVTDSADMEGELFEGKRIIVRQGLFGFEDEERRVVVEPRYVWADDFSEGRAPVAVPAKEGEGVWMGLIDAEGRMVVSAEYDDLSWDGSKYAYVDKGGWHGCLDRTGRVVVPLEYDWIGEFAYGFAVVRRDGRCGYVDEAGALVGEGLVYADANAVGADGVGEVCLLGDEEAVWIPVRLF